MTNVAPRDRVTPENKRVEHDKQQTIQVSVYIAEYQKAWIDEKNEEDKFNLSKNVRDFIDYLISEDDVDIPEEVLVDESEHKQSGIEVFIE